MNLLIIQKLGEIHEDPQFLFEMLKYNEMQGKTIYLCIIILSENSVRFEVLMAVTLKNTIFWDVMLCCLVAVY
jgi:hypothetical protein